MELFHTSNREIKTPDIYHGRKNADFGQGFYLTPEETFARRWAVKAAVLNRYELDIEGLSTHRFSRNTEWVDYIFANRKLQDSLAADVVIGPIANDTIFNTFGIIGSGVFQQEDALRLLMIGPEYIQVAIKSERAARQLRWIDAAELEPMQKDPAEEDAYLRQFSEVMQTLQEE